MESIAFISIPESLRSRFISDFSQNQQTVPIPVELSAGESSVDLENLSLEMIVAGMLRVVAEFQNGNNVFGVSAEDADYYRRFVIAARPGILGEFTEAAVLKARNGDFDMALEITAALRGLFPVSPVVLLNRALILENRCDALERAGREADAEKEWECAHEAYTELLSLDEPYPNGLFNAGFFYIKRRNYARAKECFFSYIPLADDPLKKKKAQAIVREIESCSLDDEIFREAYDFIRTGSEEKGLERIRVFLERHGAVWNGWFLLGWGLRRLERWEDGAAAFRKALELSSGKPKTLGDNRVSIRNELAICLMELEDFDGARRELEAALREESENIKIISNLAILALKQGDDAEAAAFFRTVLEIESEDPIALSYFNKGISKN